jgi:hypothetical protein
MEKKKKILSILFGATILYGGILTLTDDTEVGVTMMAVGVLLTAMPLWQAFRHFRNPPAARTNSHQSGKRRKTGHLKVVRREEEEERPTYH